MTDRVDQERAEIRSELPPEIVAAVDTIVNDLIAELGESPEAWRGAYEALEALLNRPILTGMAASVESESVMTMIMMVLGQFLSHPIAFNALTMIREAKAKAKKEES